jgi:hypothetical protein
MVTRARDVTNDTARVEALEKKLGATVLALLEVPASPQEVQLISSMNLKEGDIIDTIKMGGIHDHTWCCSVSVPPDCSVDVDG